MSEKRRFFLVHAQARQNAMECVRKAPDGFVVTVAAPTRKAWQNAHFHDQIGQISKAVGGDLADPEDAKRILISAFKIDTRDYPDLKDEWRKFGDFRVGRGLRGETVLLGAQSREFTVKLGSAFITWLDAFAADHGIEFHFASDEVATC